MTGRRARFLALFLVGFAGRAAGQYQVVGPNKCTNCHDHDPQKDWWYKKEGPQGHYNSLNQLEEKKSKAFAAADGVADVYDVKGSCVKCHATVFKGSPDFGVSCETCHGAGSGYLEPHQEKGAYQKAVSLGMFDTRGNYKSWARICLDCHFLPSAKYAKLIAAGHPPGTGFDLSVKSFGPVKHWKPDYDKAALGSAGRAYLAGKGGGAAPKEPKEEPKAEPVKPEPTKPAPSKPEPAKAEPARPEPTKPAATKPEPTKAPAKAEPTRPAERRAEPTPAAARPTLAPAPPTPRPQPTVAVEAPPTAMPVEPVATEPPAPTPAPVTLPAPPPSGALGALAEARGRIVASLAQSLRDGKVIAPRPVPAATPRTAEYRGPDAELLRLQEEVLELCLEALAAPPKKGSR